MNHWLLKSEPDSFSIDDLGKAPKQTTAWDGVRNYQARNMLRDSMKKGDLAFFYHSELRRSRHRRHRQHRRRRVIRIRPPSTPSIITTMPIPRRMRPRWFVVDVKFVRKFKRIITLDELRKHADKEAEGFRFAAPWESSVGDAGDRRRIGISFSLLSDVAHIATTFAVRERDVLLVN